MIINKLFLQETTLPPYVGDDGDQPIVPQEIIDNNIEQDGKVWEEEPSDDSQTENND